MISDGRELWIKVEIRALAGRESDEERFLCSMKDFPFKVQRLEAALEIDNRCTRHGRRV